MEHGQSIPNPDSQPENFSYDISEDENTAALNKELQKEKYQRRSEWNNTTHRYKIWILGFFIFIIGIIISSTVFHIVGPESYRWLDEKDLAILYKIASFLGVGIVGNLSKPLIERFFKD